MEEIPGGFLPNDLPPHPATLAPDYAPEEIAMIAKKLRKSVGLPEEPTGAVANANEGKKSKKSRAKKK